MPKVTKHSKNSVLSRPFPEHPPLNIATATLDQTNATYDRVYGKDHYEITNLIGNYANYPVFIQTGSLPKPTKKQLVQFLRLFFYSPTKNQQWNVLLILSLNVLRGMTRKQTNMQMGISTLMNNLSHANRA